jgi:hypothetical protein
MKIKTSITMSMSMSTNISKYYSTYCTFRYLYRNGKHGHGYGHRHRHRTESDRIFQAFELLHYCIIDYRTSRFGVDYAEVLHFNSTLTSTSTSSFLIISFHERRKPRVLRNYTYFFKTFELSPHYENSKFGHDYKPIN